MKNRTVTFLLAVALLAGAAFAGQNWMAMSFRNGATTMKIAGTAACTTKWVTCIGWRYQALYWRQWVNPGATDSGRVKWDVQAAVTDTLFPDSEADSIRSLAISLPADTTGAARAFFVQYFMDGPAFKMRLIATGLADNSDSTYIGNVYVSHDDGLPQ